MGCHVFTGCGVANMGAGRASIIAYTMPWWAAPIGPDNLMAEKAPIGALFMLAAVASWGLGTVLFRLTEWSTPVPVTIRRLLIGAVAITADAFVLKPFPDVFCLQTSTMIAIAYVFLLPMIFGQWVFHRIVNLFAAAIVAIAIMLVPVIGVMSSSLMIPQMILHRDSIALARISAALFRVLMLPTLGRLERGQ